ncbi:MAG: hypothetical protein J0L93_03315 [Deltaproteobacteria bacterium]|nr:hypothetical protein [Deltaproteobacteria bacterium]
MCQTSSLLASSDFKTLESGAEYRFVEGKNDQYGHEVDFHFDYRYHKKNSFGGLFSRLSRTYEGAPTLTDFVWGVQQSFHLSDSIYLESSATYVKEPKFSEKWSAQAAPHFIFSDGSDVSISVKLRHYFSENTTAVRVSWNKEVLDRLIIGASADSVVRPVFVISGSGFIDWTHFEKISNRFAIAGGKTYEGDRLRDKFFQISNRVGWRFIQSAMIYIDGSLYRGDRRDENKIGTGFECYF